MKTWKAGCADEQWKVDICVRDVKEAVSALLFLEYVTGSPLKELTGSQIEDALKAYAASAAKSIENAGSTPPSGMSDALRRITDPTR